MRASIIFLFFVSWMSASSGKILHEDFDYWLLIPDENFNVDFDDSVDVEKTITMIKRDNSGRIYKPDGKIRLLKRMNFK